MRTLEYTPAEASFITGLSVKAVNKALDDREIIVHTVRNRGRRHRYVPYGSVVCLQLHAEGLGQLPKKARKDLYRRIASQPMQSHLKYTEALFVDVGAARIKVRNKLKEILKAKKMIVSDPEIMGGSPVFRGTRVPVYLVADMLTQGASIEEILDGYPSLTREMVSMAPAFAKANPRRGRPPAQPWSKATPRTRKTRKLTRVA
jgi:uncharacterized protein (DUF433 family)